MKLKCFFFFIYPLLSYSFASWMENDYCERSFRPGEIIMNEMTIESNERNITIYRGKKELNSLSYYYSSEVLTVSISKTGGDIIFQVENATFINGGCDGKRTSKNSQSIKLPSTNSIVKIWAGWASEHGVVKVSKDFILLPHEKEKLSPQTIPHEQLKKDSTKELQKESHKVSPKDFYKELHRDSPREFYKDSHKDIHKETSSKNSKVHDLEYLKERNIAEIERRKQNKLEKGGEEKEEAEEEARIQKELEESKLEEERLGKEEEEGEEIEEEFDIEGLKTGIEHFDNMTQHLRGMVKENIPSEFHDLFYLIIALMTLASLYTIGYFCRCSRWFGSGLQGKSD